MIAFATAVTDLATYEEVALPSIRRIAEPDSAILSRIGCDSIQRPYNEMMDEAAAMPGLEALVLLHQDLQLLDEDLLVRVRRVFRDPLVGLFGPLGGRASKLHRWLAPDEVFGFAIGPDQADLEEPRISVGPHEVDGLDGALLIAAPWVVRGVRFSEALAEHFHGYDVDISVRVRARGGKIVCEDFPCRHHMLFKHDYAEQQAAGVALAKMWDPTLRPREWGPAFER
jgi:Glycosyltransferase like family